MTVRGEAPEARAPADIRSCARTGTTHPAGALGLLDGYQLNINHGLTWSECSRRHLFASRAAAPSRY
jgi:hypothetical protein